MNIVKKIKKELPFFLSMPALVWQMLFLGIPLVLIVAVSFTASVDLSFWSGLTLQNYIQLFDATHFSIILRSGLLALWTAFLSILIGYPVAYYLAFRARMWKNILLFFLVLPFWTNFLLQVYAWFFVLEKHGLVNDLLLMLGIIKEPLVMFNNFFAISVVMLYCYLPFMVMPIYTILEKMDETLLEASQDLGATYAQTFRNIIVPLSLPGILTGFFLVFVPAFGDFIIPLLVGGDKYMLVGSLISHYFLIAQNPGMGAAFTCFSGIVLLFLVVIINRYFSTKIKG